MANLKSLAKDTAIYGLSSIVGRFLNYLLVPLYTHYMPKDSGDYGVSTNIYAYTALILVLLTFGMETTLFRFANDSKYKPDTVFSTAMAVVGSLTAVFLLLIFGFIGPTEHPDYLLMMAVVVALDAIQAIPFSYLRFQKRAIRFASLKMLFIVLNIAMNVIYFVVLGKTSVFYVFFINLLCTGLITFFFVPDMFRIQWKFDSQLLKVMFSYSWPILVLGCAVRHLRLMCEDSDDYGDDHPGFPLCLRAHRVCQEQGCRQDGILRYSHEVFHHLHPVGLPLRHGLDASTEIHHRRRLSRRTGSRAYCNDGRDLHGHLFQPLVLV